MQQHIQHNGITLPVPQLPFGVELECYPLGVGNYLNSDRARQVLSDIKEAARAVVTASPYSGSGRCGWTAVSDYSLNNGGKEYVSPILSGENGALQVAEACRVIGALSGERKVDRKCATHIHVSIPALKGEVVPTLRSRRQFLRVLVGAWKRVENEVLLSCAPSRRDNRFAMRLGGNSGVGSDGVTQKFYSLNTECYTNGHVEFRSHQGSLDAPKILGWARFCASFVLCCEKVFAEHCNKDKPKAKGCADINAVAARAGKRFLHRHRVLVGILFNEGRINAQHLLDLGMWGSEEITCGRRLVNAAMERGVAFVRNSDDTATLSYQPDTSVDLTVRMRRVIANIPTGQPVSYAAITAIARSVPPRSLTRAFWRIKRMLNKYGISYRTARAGPQFGVILNRQDDSGEVVTVPEDVLAARTALTEENIGDSYHWLANRRSELSGGIRRVA